MAQQSTPIENIIDRNPNNGSAINETNLSTAQQILQKYNEMEAGDADEQRQQVNGNVQQRQLDPNINQQQRLQELEQNQQIHNQNLHKPTNQHNNLNNNNNNNNNILQKLKIIKNSQQKLKDVVIIVFLFISLNLDLVNNLILQYIPMLFNDDKITINGIIAKGIIAGGIYYIISTLLLVL